MRFFTPLRPLLQGWLLCFLAWGFIAALQATDLLVDGPGRWREALHPGFSTWLPWLLLTPLLFRFVARLPLDRQHWLAAVPAHLLCCGAAVALCHEWRAEATALLFGAVPASETMERGLGPPMEMPPPPPRDGPGFSGERPPFPRGEAAGHHFPGRPGAGAYEGPPGFAAPPPPPRSGPEQEGRVLAQLFHTVAFVLPMYGLILSCAQARVSFRREQRSAAKLAQARLEALRAQLQPHFLFNSLNTVSGLLHDEPDKADALLTDLSDLLRLTITSQSEQEVTLGRELKFIACYLSIMHARFEERLRFVLEVAPDARAALVPAYMLQPIVENAVRHELDANHSSGLIALRAWRERDTLHVTVSDRAASRMGGEEAGENPVLSELRLRLHDLYGQGASLMAGEGCLVAITLPFHAVTQ